MSMTGGNSGVFIGSPYNGKTFSPKVSSSKMQRRLVSMDRWEFLVICRDAAAYKTITAAVQKINGAVNYSWNTAGARAYIARRKIDGIFLETALPGTLNLIQAIRGGNSNRFAVIFGCADESED